jgi:CheY-like chemotaxis protein
LGKPIDRRRLLTILRKYQKDREKCLALIVEDNTETRDLLRRTMEKEGWSVREAENGRAALDRVADGIPNLILLDLLMPHMNGFEFVTELRKNELWKSIPVIVITAKDLTAEDRMRLNGYVEMILQKGAFGQDELIEEIRTLVSDCAERRLSKKE